MDSITAKAAAWLRKQQTEKPVGAHGEQKALERATGLDQSLVNRAIKAGRWDPSLSTLERIAQFRRARFGEDARVFEIVHEIDSEVIPERKRPVPIEERWLDLWRHLFRGNPRRAQRILVNIRHQEELGYTDLISNVVRMILRDGPEKASHDIAAVLFKAGRAMKETDKTRKIREKQAAEYEEIG